MISLIAVVFNHYQDVTKPFIEEVLSKTKGDYELIIVNNGQQEVPSGRGYKVIKAKKNLGYGSGCNLGYKQAKGDYIVFMNNDVVIENPNWLQNLKSFIDNNPGALIGPQLVFDNTLTSFKNKPVPYLNGWFIVAKRDIFEAIAEEGKVFDEKFFLYFEDTELSYRAALLGFKLTEIKDLGIKHLISKSSNLIKPDEIMRISQRYYTNKLTFLTLEKNKKKRIVFYFKCSYPFVDSDYEGKGVGGAEAALILLSREFAKKGWQVEVYNTTEKIGIFGGVEYHHVSEFNPGDYMDVFVLFREPYRWLSRVNAITKIFWSCDQETFGDWQREILSYVDRVVAISTYHAKYIAMRWGIEPNQITVIDLGIKAADYEEPVKKIPGKLLYCSVPRRGLEHLVRLFPQIRERVPSAELYITSDYRLWGATEPLNGEFTAMFAKTEGVHFLGKVARKELVYHQLTSEVMVYPCTYEECFCISAMECIAAGAIPITTGVGALKTTVGESGIVLSNFPGTDEYDKQFIDSVVKLLTDSAYANKLRAEGRKRALDYYSWEKVTQNWINMIKEQEEKMITKKGKVCDVEGCGVAVANSYVLAKHKAKAHADDKVASDEIPTTPEIYTRQLLRFKVPVAFNINGTQYKTEKNNDLYEVEVEYDRVPAAMDIVRNSYGSEAFDF